jgi:hypothetical protein
LKYPICSLDDTFEWRLRPRCNIYM